MRQWEARNEKREARNKKQETEKEYGQRPKGAIGAQTDFRKNSSVPADGTVGVGATQGASVFEEVQSERTKKQTVPIGERERPPARGDKMPRRAGG